MLRSILEKYNAYFRGKPTQQLQFSNGVPLPILNFESNLYAKVIHSLKKILKYLHHRLSPMILITENPHTVMILKPYQQNKVFYLNFFNCAMNYYVNCKQKYRDIKPIID